MMLGGYGGFGRFVLLQEEGVIYQWNRSEMPARRRSNIGRNTRANQAFRRHRENLTPAQREQMREAARLQMARNREKETVEQRNQRLASMREAARKSRKRARGVPPMIRDLNKTAVPSLFPSKKQPSSASACATEAQEGKLINQSTSLDFSLKRQKLVKNKSPVKSSDSTNGTSNENRNPRKRRLKLLSESDTEPEDQSVDDVDEEFVLFGKHVASKLNQMPFYNALQCQEKIEALINDELLIVQSRQEEIDTRLIKQEPEISDELCDENNIQTEIKQELSIIDEGRLLVQSCQNEIETVIIKQEPGISDELCDENNTPTLLNQVPASPFSLYSIKTENISDTELQ